MAPFCANLIFFSHSLLRLAKQHYHLHVTLSLSVSADCMEKLMYFYNYPDKAKCLHSAQKQAFEHTVRHLLTPSTTWSLLVVIWKYTVYISVHFGLSMLVGRTLSKQMPEVLNWICSSCLWELGSQSFIGVFLLPEFKRKAEMIHQDVSADVLDVRAAVNTLYNIV